MSSEFWINDNGQNMLKGVAGDTSNPIMLPDEWVVDFLLRIPDARASFDRLYPDLLPGEKTRLEVLRSTAASQMILDEVTASDRLQLTLNRSGIQRGGGWCPPPWPE